MVPYDQLNTALTDAIDVATYLDLIDRAHLLATHPIDREVDDRALHRRRSITVRAGRVADFMRLIAQSLTASLRAEPMTIFELVRDSYDRARRKGFWDDVEGLVLEATGAEVRAKINEKLLLTISELTEAMEEIRSGRVPHDIDRDEDGKPRGFPIELADAMIRIGDLAGWLDIDLTAAVRMKAEYNESRPHKHGKQF